MERHPVIIIGSGPAGTATALRLHALDPALARDALVLEKATHPRPKVCAGGLIPAGVDCLQQLGVELSVPHVAVHRAQVATPTRVVAHDERNLCYVVRRNEFDASLVDACRARGITVQEQEPVLDLRREEGGVRVETSRGVYWARLVIGADGSGSLVRRRLVDDAKGQTARAVMCDIPVDETSWQGFAEGRYDFDFRTVKQGLPGYLWAFPCLIDGRPHANVGGYALNPIGAALNRLVDDYIAEMGGGDPPRQAFPIRWYRSGTRLAAPNVLLVGDAAGVDPLMGEGISLALEYGLFAGDAVREALRTGDLSGAAYQQAIEGSWLGKKLRRLHLATRVFYGPAWRAGFALAERSARVRAIGLRWYNGVDGWDRRSGWEAIGAVVRGT